MQHPIRVSATASRNFYTESSEYAWVLGQDSWSAVIISNSVINLLFCEYRVYKTYIAFYHVFVLLLCVFYTFVLAYNVTGSF